MTQRCAGWAHSVRTLVLVRHREAISDFNLAVKVDACDRSGIEKMMKRNEVPIRVPITFD